jgi:hypothetical protein
MGNEFGHPEWIDFPREGNGWSFHYCRRQWSLTDNSELKYEWLNNFDHDMIHVAKSVNLFSQRMGDLRLKTDFHQKVIAFTRAGLMFAFNFHHDWSQVVRVPVIEDADYYVDFSSDDWSYGGWGQVHRGTHQCQKAEDGSYYIELYLPARTAVVLRRGEVRQPVIEEPVVEETPVVVEEPVVETAPVEETVPFVSEEAAVAVSEEPVVTEEAPVEKPAPKKRAPRTKKVAADTAEKKPAAKKTTTRKTTKKAAEETPTEEAPKKKRAPRTKKTEQA